MTGIDDKMNRLVIIDHRLASGHRGIVFEGRNAKIDLAVQDHGETLKVFVTDAEEENGRPVQGGDDDSGQDDGLTEAFSAGFEQCRRRAVQAEAEVERLTAEVARLREAARHPHKGPNDTDASMLIEAAKRAETGYPVGGSNTQAVAGRVLRAVAAALGDGA